MPYLLSNSPHDGPETLPDLPSLGLYQPTMSIIMHVILWYYGPVMLCAKDVADLMAKCVVTSRA